MGTRQYVEGLSLTDNTSIGLFIAALADDSAILPG
jgi:hypothetical protein